MEQVGVRASFPEGGAPSGPFSRWEDLPANEAERDRLLCAGLPQPDGMAGPTSPLRARGDGILRTARTLAEGTVHAPAHGLEAAQ